MSALHWVKSSFSGGGGNNCVELATVTDAHRIAIRESDRPTEILTAHPTALNALLRTVKHGAPGVARRE